MFPNPRHRDGNKPKATEVKALDRKGEDSWSEAEARLAHALEKQGRAFRFSVAFPGDAPMCLVPHLSRRGDLTAPCRLELKGGCAPEEPSFSLSLRAWGLGIAFPCREGPHDHRMADVRAKQVEML